MTIVIALGNEDQFIQLSDRRLSSGATAISDEADKAAMFICANGRFAIGFAGLGKAGGFRTREWLLEESLRRAPPDFHACETLERLKDSLCSDYFANPWLVGLPRTQLRLSIMCSGYLYHHEPPLAASAVITNFQGYESGVDDIEAWSAFRTTYLSEKRPYDGPLTYLQRIGIWPAMSAADEAALRAMLENRLPADAIVDKGVELIRELADRPQAGGAIGKQISSILVPRDPGQPVTTAYHTEGPSRQMFLPSLVVAVSDNECFAAKDLSVSVKDAAGRAVPAAVPKVRGNQPCPCGSGRKYKNCHGRKELRGPRFRHR
jgi:hypothetical protein